MSRVGMSGVFPLALLLLLAAAPAAASGSAPTLKAQGDAAAGHVTLQWQAGEKTPVSEFLLQESKSEDFQKPRTLYQGPHQASVLSGLPDGSYHFRVRARPAKGQTWGPWSEPQMFTVEHHPLPLALILFGLGATVFGLTLAFLLAFARKAT